MGMISMRSIDPTDVSTEEQIRRDEAARIAAEIERFRGFLISRGDRRDDDEINGLYRAATIARQHAYTHDND